MRTDRLEIPEQSEEEGVKKYSLENVAMSILNTNNPYSHLKIKIRIVEIWVLSIFAKKYCPL